MTASASVSVSFLIHWVVLRFKNRELRRTAVCLLERALDDRCDVHPDAFRWPDLPRRHSRLRRSQLHRFGALPTADAGVSLRNDNGQVYASKLYRKLAKSHGLHQEFISPHTPEQNGVAESFMGTFKCKCV